MSWWINKNESHSPPFFNKNGYYCDRLQHNSSFYCNYLKVEKDSSQLPPPHLRTQAVMGCLPLYAPIYINLYPNDRWEIDGFH